MIRHCTKEIRLSYFEDGELTNDVVRFNLFLQDKPRVVKDSIVLQRLIDPHTTDRIYIFRWDENDWEKKPVKQHTWRRKIK